VSPIAKNAGRRLSCNDKGLWLWVPACAGTTMCIGHDLTFPRRDASESRIIRSPWRAWGMPGVQCTRSLACEKQKHTSKAHHRSTGSGPAFPHANGFNGFLRALPGEPGFVATIAREIITSTGLTSASGCQDHTTSPSAMSSASSLRAISVHRIPPHVRDDRETPLVWDGMGESWM
jgi:hypothetical protein